MNNIEQHRPVLLQQDTMASEWIPDKRVKKQQINSREGCDSCCSRSMALSPQAGGRQSEVWGRIGGMW